MKSRQGIITGEGGTVIFQGSPKSGANLLLSLLLRLFFLFGTSAGASAIVIDAYSLPIGLKVVFAFCFGFTALFYLSAMLFRPIIAFLIYSAAAAVTLFFCGDIIGAFRDAFDYAMFTISHGNIDLTAYCTANSINELTVSADFLPRMFSVGIVFSLLSSLMAVLSGRRKFLAFTPIGITLVFVIPSLICGAAGLSEGYLPFFVGIFGLYAATASREMENRILYREMGKKQAGINVFREERYYVKKSVKLSPKEKLKSDTGRYASYAWNAFFLAGIAGVSALVAFFAVGDDAAAVYKGFLKNITTAITGGIEQLTDDFMTGDMSMGGYFSAADDNEKFGDIDISAPKSDENDTLNVTLQSSDEPIYLRGDIGVSFTGSGWTTLANSKAPEIERLYELVSSGFYPETEYQIFRQKLLYLGYTPSDFFGLQKVAVEYVSGSNVVFMPTASLSVDYRDDTRFNVYGDAIMRVKSGMGALRIYESHTIYPVMTNSLFSSALKTVASAFTAETEKSLKWNFPDDIGYQEYTDRLKSYRDVISSLYLDVPAEEKGGIDTLITDVERDLGKELSVSLPYERLSAAYAIEGYMRHNYSYSLNTDNDSSEATTLTAFLTETRSGHCALYASAMTLAMRELGIPARYVTGYVADAAATAKTDDEGNYICNLKSKDLHAWTEVYIENVGWLPFDPTGGSDDITQALDEKPKNADEKVTKPEETQENENNEKPSEKTDTEKAAEGRLNPLLIIIPIAACAVIAAFFILNSHKLKEKKLFAELRHNHSDENVKLMYRLIITLLSFDGVAPSGGELPYEYARRVDKAYFGSEDNSSFFEQISVMERLEFGGGKIEEAEYDEIFKLFRCIYTKVAADKPFIKAVVRRAQMLRYLRHNEKAKR